MCSQASCPPPCPTASPVTAPLPAVTWQRLIQKHGGTVGHGLDLSALATVSDGYSQGPMAQVVRAVLTERRILQLPRRPLRAEEFLQLLPKADPVYPEEEKMLQVPAPSLPTAPAVTTNSGMGWVRSDLRSQLCCALVWLSSCLGQGRAVLPNTAVQPKPSSRSACTLALAPRCLPWEH